MSENTFPLYGQPLRNSRLVAGDNRKWRFRAPSRRQKRVFRRVRKGEPADKPGSVEGSHSSGACVAAGLKRPTRERRGPRHGSPTWPCSGWGLPCHRCYHRRGALLPHLFTLTPGGGIFSVALSVGSRPPGITWHPALWSPDFPPRHQWRSGCLAGSRAQYNRSGCCGRRITDGRPSIPARADRVFDGERR